MNEYDFGSGGTPQKRDIQRSLDGKTQYLLRAEGQLLQSISSHAFLPRVLNEICSALDIQIGNVVSFISLPGNDASKLATTAMNGALFGLHVFCSEGVVAENDELLGSLEMYCCVQRRPSCEEFRLIDRAKCLAAMAIKRHNEAQAQSNCRMRGNRPIRGRVLAWPASMASLQAGKFLPNHETTKRAVHPRHCGHCGFASLVQHDAQEGSVDLKTAVIPDEAQFLELVHEKIDP